MTSTRRRVVRPIASKHIAIGMAVFDSTGYTKTGTPYERPGRAMIVLGRGASVYEWVAHQMHGSVFSDVPTRSFGRKPEPSPAM
jgi:hypothetical protein